MVIRNSFAIFILIFTNQVTGFTTDEWVKYLDSLRTIDPLLYNSVIYMVDCNTTDETLFMINDLYTSKRLNLKIAQSVLSPPQESTIIVCNQPDKGVIQTTHTTFIFLTDNTTIPLSFEANGYNNTKYLINSQFNIFQAVYHKATFDKVSFLEPLDLTGKKTESGVDLQGLELTVGYIEYEGYLTYNKSTGFDLKFGKLFEIMKKQMNFTYKAIPSKDGGYGSLLAKPIKFNGHEVTHTGLIGMLEGKEIDVGLADLSYTYSRSQKADFGGMMMLQRTILIVKKIGAGGDDYKYWAFFTVLFKDVWAAYLVSAVVFSLFTFVLTLFALRDCKQELTMWNILALASDNIAFSIRTMSTKDNYMLEEIRYKYVWRFVMFTFILTGYFAVETYNAELTTSLTKKEVKMPIQRLEDILDNDMKLSLPKGTFYVTQFEFAEDGDWYKDIYRDKVQGQKYGVVQQTEELVVEALKDNYVVLTSGEVAFLYKNNHPCLVEIVPKDPILETVNQIGMYIQKGSPLTQMFRNQIGTLHESGVINVITKDSGSTLMKECQGQSLVLGLGSCIFLFVCIAAGIALSVLTLIIEIIADKLGIFNLNIFYFYTE